MNEHPDAIAEVAMPAIQPPILICFGYWFSDRQCKGLWVLQVVRCVLIIQVKANNADAVKGGNFAFIIDR